MMNPNARNMAYANEGAISNSVAPATALESVITRLVTIQKQLEANSTQVRDVLNRAYGAPPEVKATGGNPRAVPAGKVDDLMQHLNDLDVVLSEQAELLQRLQSLA